MADDSGKHAKPSAEDRRRMRAGAPAGLPVRDADIEPQRGIRYVGKMFKIIAALLVVVMIAEVVLGLTDPRGEGLTGTILGEAVRMLAFAGLLWGGADLSMVLIKSHYDIRATRILMQRQNHLLQKSVRGASGAGAQAGGTTQPRSPAP